MSQRRLPAQFKAPSSRKGKKQTSLELQAKKPRLELSLKLKCAIIDEAKKRGFQPENVERTLNQVNQTQLGATIAASVRGLNRAYPPNLLDAAFLAHQAWDS